MINNLHVEASTYCNARCPGCPRNANGVNLPGLFPLEHLKVDVFKNVVAKFPDLEYINFNGNLGDPMMNPHIIELVKASGIHCNVTTNGSIGKLDVFKQLAQMGHEVTFSIDGLEDTNHLYRQDVDWNKIMERVKIFIEHGGVANWKYVIFRHNRHQTQQAEELSKQLGFKSFETIDHGRNYFPALTQDRKVSHWIMPADGDQQPDDAFDPEKYVKMVLKPYDLKPPRYNKKVSCEYLRGSVYVSASGGIHPCCYQGFDLPDRKAVTLDQFDSLRKTWETDNTNAICAENCATNQTYP